MSRGESAPPESAAHDLRCGCGSLLARRTPDGIELKCRRCRRAILLRMGADGEVSLETVDSGPGAV